MPDTERPLTQEEVASIKLRADPPRLHHENLYSALVLAIESRTATEQKLGYTGDSAMLATWKLCVAALQEGILPRVDMAGPH